MEIDEITPKQQEFMKKFCFSLKTICEEDSFVDQDSLVNIACQTSYVSTNRNDKINYLKEELLKARELIANEPSKFKSILTQNKALVSLKELYREHYCQIHE